MIYSGIVGALESLNPSFNKKDPTSIFAITKTTHRNLPDDWDFNIHMNNEYFPLPTLSLFETAGDKWKKLTYVGVIRNSQI